MMQLINKLETHSKQKIIEFLDSKPVGRIASIDSNGYPQVIPKNFIYLRADDSYIRSRTINLDAIYMHSYPIGEKLDNIRINPKVGFEVDRHVCFLPSYYFHPTDASQADTLYISVVIKGNAVTVADNEEKAEALNALMRKYQKIDLNMQSVHQVTVIKSVPDVMRGKYKLGQHWAPTYRLKMAKNIVNREGKEIAMEFSISWESRF